MHIKPAYCLSLSLFIAFSLPADGSAQENNKSATEQAYRYGVSGRLYDKPGEEAKAIEAFDKSLSIKPDSVIYVDRAGVKNRLKDYAGAIADYDKAIELKSGLNFEIADLYLLYHRRGEIKKIAKDYVGAIADYDKAIELKPSHGTFHSNRAAIKHLFGDFAGAIVDYDHAIRLEPKSALFYNNRAYSRATNGDVAGAGADYSKAIELEPMATSFRGNFANFKRDQGDFAGAVVITDKILELEPKNLLHYYNRGNFKQLNGDFAAAIDDYNKLIEALPGNAIGYLQRGTALQSQGKSDAAIVDYDKGISIRNDPADFGWVYREIIFRQLKRRTPNEELLKIGAKLGGDLPKDISRYLAGSMNEADFLAIPKSPAVRCMASYLVGMTRLFSGDRAGARKFLEQSVATKNYAATEFVLARSELSRLSKAPNGGE